VCKDTTAAAADPEDDNESFADQGRTKRIARKPSREKTLNAFNFT